MIDLPPILGVLSVGMAILVSIAISLALSAAIAAATYFLTSKPKSEAEFMAQQEEISIPTARDGEIIPVVVGLFKYPGQFMWPMNGGSMPKKKKRNFIDTDAGKFGGGGTAQAEGPATWFLSWSLCLGWGPLAELRGIIANDIRIWPQVKQQQLPSVLYTPEDGVSQISCSATISLDRTVYNWLQEHGYPTTPVLWQSGALLFWGTDDQPLNGVIYSEAKIPQYKGIAHLDFWKVAVGSSPTTWNTEIVCRRDPQSPLTNAHTTIAYTVGSKSYTLANPVHHLMEVLTNTLWGAGMGMSLFDQDSFETAAETCYTENRGIGYALTTPQSVSVFADDIGQYIDCFFVRRANQVLIKLRRYDYDPESETECPTIPEGAISDWNMRSESPATVANNFNVEYKDAFANWKTRTVPIQIPSAAINIDSTKTETIKLPYFCDRDTAYRIGFAKAQELVSPRRVVTCGLNRKSAFLLELGDVIRPVYSPDSIDGSIVFRIIAIERPVGGNVYAKVTLAEEIGVTSHPELPADPEEVYAADSIAGPLTHQKIVELPYDLASGEASLFSLLAGRSQDIATHFEVRGGADAEADAGDVVAKGLFLETAVLVAGYAATTLTVDDVGFTVSPGFDFAQFASVASISRAKLFGRYQIAVIDDEFIAFQIVDVVSSAPPRYQVSGIIRGLFDTAPTAHAAGAVMYVLREGTVPYSFNGRGDWATGATLSMLALPYNETDIGDPDEFDPVTLDVESRSKLPYPPSNLCADGLQAEHLPTFNADGSSTIRLSWIPHNRGSGCGYDQPDGPFATPVAVEDGMDFEVTLLLPGETDPAASRTYTVAASTTIPSGFFTGRVYKDVTFNIATLGNPLPASVVARVHSRIGIGWQSRRPTTLTITKAS